MKKLIFMIHFILFSFFSFGQGYLKSIIYDFDGLDIGQTNLPDGDYKNNDMTYQVAVNPLAASDVLGDRVLQLNLNWQTGIGEFGKNLARFIELNSSTDRFNFYFYNPMSNSDNAVMHIGIEEDDNGDNIFNPNTDDKWIAIVTVPPSSGWQLISLPLNSFADSTAGGNGIFDAGYIGNGGMIFSIGFIFYKPLMANVTEQYFIDMISFSEGILPTGASVLDLPAKSPPDHCSLGGLTFRQTSDSIPADIEGLFVNPPGKKLKYINWFVDYSNSGTVPINFPGQEVQNLLNGGYRPVITWEMIYGQYPRLDPVQPRLDKIINGYFDSYLDAFADKIKSYSDTVVLRIFHEFEGNWYPWSLTENYKDPNIYIAAFRHVVDRFRSRGANNVQWMWCVNAEPKPYLAYNWIVAAYPGDSYVDIVATDIYNHPDLGIPAWKSFRYTLAEHYYYLSKYFPNKLLFICEVGCREREASEDPSSQTKPQWLCEMSKELQSYFSKARALIFFSAVKEHDWRINSSSASVAAVENCIWNDPYYIGNFASVSNYENQIALNIFPNPFTNEINIAVSEPILIPDEIRIYNVTGELIFSEKNYKSTEKIILENDLAPGMYFIELKSKLHSKTFKICKNNLF